MTVKQWLFTNKELIDSANPRFDAELLLAERLGKCRAYLHAFDDSLITDELLCQLEQDIQQLACGYPLAYLLGKKAFWDMELRVNEATLIPRADTETLLETAVELFPASTTAKMIDLGTGSGAIAIALSRIFPKASITATDFCEAALAVARENAESWQIAPITFLRCSWLDGFDSPQFDLIASNPPYIVEGDIHLAKLTHEPQTALTAEKQGLADIEYIIQQAQYALNPSGWLLLEHGYDQGSAVRQLLSDRVWQNVQTRYDLGGNERITFAQVVGSTLLSL